MTAAAVQHPAVYSKKLESNVEMSVVGLQSHSGLMFLFSVAPSSVLRVIIFKP